MYLFDLEDYATIYKEPTHFNCSGYYNGKQSWLSDDATIKVIWDNTLTPNCWRLSGDSLGNTQIINTNPASPPINGNWTVVGASYFVTANKGACVPVTQLVMSVIKNNPTCKCDATLTVNASGGVPPYQYSFNNGVSYGNTPFAQNICGGRDITVMTKDSAGTVVSSLVQIPAQQSITEYNVRFEATSSVLNPDGTTQATYNLIVTPQIPAGVTLNLDVSLRGVFTRTPYINSATGTYIHQVKKNNTLITSFTDESTESTTPNVTAGCQSYLMYRTNYQYTYSNVQLTESDTLVVIINDGFAYTCSNKPPSTQSSVLMGDENDSTLGPLGYSQVTTVTNTYLNCCYANISHYIDYSNLKLVGCDCCEIKSYTKPLYE